MNTFNINDSYSFLSKDEIEEISNRISLKVKKEIEYQLKKLIEKHKNYRNE